MGRPSHGPVQLPKRILEELGGSVQDYHGKRREKAQRGTRKEQRKAIRVEKKTKNVPTKKTTARKRFDDSSNDTSSVPAIVVPQHVVSTAAEQFGASKSILKTPKILLDASPRDKNGSSESSSPRPALTVSKQAKAQLAKDDAEIEALERALGFDKKKTLPKSFEADGLDSLLEGLDQIGSPDQVSLGKRKRHEEKVWLEQKRQRNYASGKHPIVIFEELDTEFEGFGSEDDTSSEEDGVDDVDDDREDSNERSISLSPEADDIQQKANRVRENPFLAPATGSFQKIAKYIPPSLRDTNETMSEELSRLRRQLQGLINRLSEANLLSIVGEVEKLYLSHARQIVSGTLIDILMGLLSDPSFLQDTFIILHAGFITALYKIIGTDFGAQVVSRIDKEFDHYYQEDGESSDCGKRINNLVSLLAQMYIFQVISSDLVYDYARLCLNDLSERNTELLLRIIRVVGHQLRHDDPSSLKEVMIRLNEVAAELGIGTLSVRTKFMIETINNLKNNKMKTGIAAASIASEHTISMKKTLGSLNQHNIKGTEPLRIGLVDIRDSEKRGKWWVIGAGYKDHDQQDTQSIRRLPSDRQNNVKKLDFVVDSSGDLTQLASEQRMNTDVRRSIFVAIMSATDYNDAYVRLMKLRLKKSQQLEVPKVLMQCAGAEEAYNPFYTLLSRRVCSDRKLKMAFQFALWDLFRSMGEHNDDDDSDDDDEDDAMKGKSDLRTRVNLSRMFGTLIAHGSLSLGVLKNLNIAYLRPKTSMFVEILLITLIIQTQRSAGEKRNEASLVDVFIRPKEMTDLASSLRYFLENVVAKGDIAGSGQDRETVRWGCRVASDALFALTVNSRPST